MKTIIKILVFAILGMTWANAQVFTPPAKNSIYMPSSKNTRTVTNLRGDGARRDTLVYTFKTPLYGVWKNDTAITVLGMSKSTSDSITYIVKYRATDPYGTAITSSWTSIISASSAQASQYYFKYTPLTAFIEVQVTAYYPGASGAAMPGLSNILTVYCLELKQ